MKNFWKNKKVVVTGASGFVGSNVVKTLIEKESRVTAVVSQRTTTKKIREAFGKQTNKIIIKKADLLNFQDCLAATKKQDIVLNFAAMDGGLEFKKKYPAKIFTINTQIVLNMLEASVKHKVDRVLLVSSIEVYPKNSKTPIKEEYALQENFYEDTNGYVWSKRFGEIAANMYSKEYGLKIAIVRPGNIYGPGDKTGLEKNRVIPTFIQKILHKEKIALFDGGLQKKQFLYIADAVDAFLKATEKYAVCDPVNIAGNEVITIKQLADIIQSIVDGCKVEKMKFTKKKMERVISINKLEKLVGFIPHYSFIDGLKETILPWSSS